MAFVLISACVFIILACVSAAVVVWQLCRSEKLEEVNGHEIDSVIAGELSHSTAARQGPGLPLTSEAAAERPSRHAWPEQRCSDPGHAAQTPPVKRDVSMSTSVPTVWNGDVNEGEFYSRA
jgi:hypothetical protein